MNTFRFPVLTFAILAASFASAQSGQKPAVIRGKHAVSQPVSSLVTTPKFEKNAVRPVDRAAVPAGATAGMNFDGTVGTGYAYSDATGAVGATQYVHLINTRYTIYNKTTGAVVKGPFAENILWKTFGGPCQTTANGDGTIMYDQAAKRWVFQHHAYPVGGPYLDCVAVSKTSDATGAYNLYGFELTIALPDSPKLAVWPDAYYIGQNLLDPTTKSFQRAQVCALDRTAMLAGLDANAICFQGSISLPTILPVNWYGGTAPPAGSPEYFFELDQRPGQGQNQMNEYAFHVDFVTPENSTFTQIAAFQVPAYRDSCYSACVPQANTTNVVRGYGDRLMHPLVYRNLGNHESILLTHTVSTTTKLTDPSGIRWYEIRTPATPVIYQSGTFAPDGNYRFVPSIGMDRTGDIAVGYSVSGPSVFPSIRYTGRIPSEPLGTLEAETSIMEGTGSQLSTNGQWSGYSGMSLDPVDNCTFWYTNQYYKADSVSGWSTRIASFKFPNCH